MLQGKVKAAVRWATQRTREELLMPDDIVDGLGITVLDILCQKHFSAQPTDAYSQVPCATLSLFEDVEITGSHLLFVTHCTQEGAGPGGCNAGHWRDVLLHFGAHSSRLRDPYMQIIKFNCSMGCESFNSFGQVPWCSPHWYW